MVVFSVPPLAGLKPVGPEINLYPVAELTVPQVKSTLVAVILEAAKFAGRGHNGAVMMLISSKALSP